MELFKGFANCADGSKVEVVAYTWDNKVFQVDIIEGEVAFCDFARKCTAEQAIEYAKQCIKEIEFNQLREKASILADLAEKNRSINNKIVKKILAIALDKAATFGEVRNAVTMASNFIEKTK